MDNKILYNKDIAEQYNNITLHLMLSDFRGAFICCAIRQDTVGFEDLIVHALHSYTMYLRHKYFMTTSTVVKFTYSELENEISETTFASIPAILSLNKTKPDFIDLGALARNMFFMICRELITQPL